MRYLNFSIIAVSLLGMACSSVQAQQGETPTSAPESSTTGTKQGEQPAAAAAAPVKAENTEPAVNSPAAPSEAGPVEKALGGPGLAIITGADRAELVEVASNKNPDAKQHLQEHEVKSTPIALTPEALKTFQEMIQAKETHVFGARARCRFRPTHGLIFYRGEQKTSVLIAAPRCAKWAFEKEPKRKIIDIRKPAGQTVADLISQIKGGGSQ